MDMLDMEEAYPTPTGVCKYFLVFSGWWMVREGGMGVFGIVLMIRDLLAQPCARGRG